MVRIPKFFGGPKAWAFKFASRVGITGRHSLTRRHLNPIRGIFNNRTIRNRGLPDNNNNFTTLPNGNVTKNNTTRRSKFRRDTETAHRTGRRVTTGRPLRPDVVRRTTINLETRVPNRVNKTVRLSETGRESGPTTSAYTNRLLDNLGRESRNRITGRHGRRNFIT